MRGDNKFSYKKKQNKSYRHRPYIACKAFSFCAEVEEAKYQNRNNHYLDEDRVGKWLHGIVDIQKESKTHKSITSRNTVYAIHKIEYIYHASANDERYRQPQPTRNSK